jgi:hypothetical protein
MPKIPKTSKNTMENSDIVIYTDKNTEKRFLAGFVLLDL